MKRMSTAILMGGLVLSPLATPAPRAQDAAGARMGLGINCLACPWMPAEYWKDKLKLSGKQTERLRTALDERNNAALPLVLRLREIQRRLDAQLRDKSSNAELEATLIENYKLGQDLQTANDKFRIEAMSFLTPAQRAAMLLEIQRASASGAPGATPPVR